MSYWAASAAPESARHDAGPPGLSRPVWGRRLPLPRERAFG